MSAERYSARTTVIDSVEVVQLSDAEARVAVSVAPSVGNVAYDMTVAGKPILLRPGKNLGAWKASPTHAGVPFLAPWASRLSGDSFWFGEEHRLRPELVDFSRDAQGRPNQGLVAFASDWRVVGVRADDRGAEVTSRLEFWQHPEWMAQFPFEHAYEMTHRVSGGELEIRTVVENRSTKTMPVFVGFHPWFRIPFSSRERWRVHLPVSERWVLSDSLLPTGQRAPVALEDPLPLAGRELDDVFGGLSPNDELWVEANGARIAARFGPKFPVVIAYAPRAGNVICLEPMTAVPNAFDLARAGAQGALQTVAPGERWVESFFIRASGL